MVILYLKLAFATASCSRRAGSSPGRSACAASPPARLVARRRVRALAVTFAVGATLTLDARRPRDRRPGSLVLAASGGLAAGRPVPGVDGCSSGARSSACCSGSRRRPCRATAFPSRARRKLLDLDDLSLDRVSEFADGSLHPGYAFPLWHGFLALIAQFSRARIPSRSSRTCRRSSPRSPCSSRSRRVGALPADVGGGRDGGGAGRDDLRSRRAWAAPTSSLAPATSVAAAPRAGRARARARVGALAVARARRLDGRPPGFVLAVVHPTYAIFLWIPFVGFLVVRRCGSGRTSAPGALALGALVVPAALFMLWLRPIVDDTRSVSPDADELQRAFEQYGSQLVVHSDTVVQPRAGGVHARGRGRDRRAAPDPARRLRRAAAVGRVRRRRLARRVRGDARAVPLHVARRPRLDLAGAARAGFLPFAFAFAGGMGVLARLVGPILLPARARRGDVPADRLPGRLRVRPPEPAPAWIAWFAVLGAVAALVVGFIRRRPALETGASLAAAAFLIPVFGGGLLDWSDPTRPRSRRSRRARRGRARRGRAGDDRLLGSETSFRLAAFAPVYIAVAPPGHVADTEENRPYERASDARRFFRTGDLSIPRGYGAEYVVVDGLRSSSSSTSRRLLGRPVHRLPALAGRPQPPPPESRCAGGRPARGRDSRSPGAPRRSGSSGRASRPRLRARRGARRRGAG